MNAPSTDRLLAALETTWPPARVFETPAFRLREGLGGGQRVSSALSLSTPTEAQITQAETAMHDLGQHPIFMLRKDETAFDAALAERGYVLSDPTVLYRIPAATIAAPARIGTVFPTWPPFAIQVEIWERGGIGSARLAVMQRAPDPKTSLLCRIRDTPAATLFAAVDGPIAMLHALEVAPSQRRKGLGETALRATAEWALSQGAEWLALAVTQANAAANALYRKLGMEPAGTYHYRRAPEARS